MSISSAASTLAGRARSPARAHGLALQPVAAHVVVILAAAGCWALALIGATPALVSGWGLLGALPPTYLLGLVILAIGFSVAATCEEPRPLVLGAYVIALVAMLSATAAILYPEPRYAWVYKHLGVIDYFRVHHGRTDRNLDIYNNWPAFFALNAWFGHTLGVEPIRYANWAQPFFGLADVSALLFAIRGVTRSVRVQWTAAWLFVVADWIGQDYLSPQGFAFFLALVTIGLLLRCAPARRLPRTAAVRRLERVIGNAGMRVRRHGRPALGFAEAPPLGARAGLALAGLCYMGVVLTHQLSPVLVLISASLLTVTVRRPRLWVLAVMLAVEALWVWRAYPFVSAHFQLFNLGLHASARPSLSSAAKPLAGVVAGEDLSRAAIVAIVLVAIAGIWRGLLRGPWEPAAIALVVGSGLIVVGAQSYGEEGPLRAYLFALPWLATFAAAAVQPPTRASPMGRPWRLLAVTLLVGGCGLTGQFGQDSLHYFTPADVHATKWYLDHAPNQSSVTYLTLNVPDMLDANYARHLQTHPVLTQSQGFSGSLAQTMQILECDTAPEQYVLFTPSQERYLRYYGLLPASTYGDLVSGMERSHAFELLYRNGRAFVFLFKARSTTATAGVGGRALCPRTRPQ